VICDSRLQISSNNAVILWKAQTFGELKEGETLKFEKRGYEFKKLKQGEFVIKALYLSIDMYLVHPHFSLSLLIRGTLIEELN
jgi:hypothetical protein